MSWSFEAIASSIERREPPAAVVELILRAIDEDEDFDRMLLAVDGDIVALLRARLGPLVEADQSGYLRAFLSCLEEIMMLEERMAP